MFILYVETKMKYTGRKRLHRPWLGGHGLRDAPTADEERYGARREETRPRPCGGGAAGLLDVDHAGGRVVLVPVGCPPAGASSPFY